MKPQPSSPLDPKAPSGFKFQVSRLYPTRFPSRPLARVLLFWAVFMLLYFLYRALPVFPLSLICAVNESIFQHLKATFFSWLIVGLIESRLAPPSPSIGNVVPNVGAGGEGDSQTTGYTLPATNFWFPRLTTAVFAPWIVFLLWYIAPATYGKMLSLPLEIIYANIITLLAAYCAVVFEQGLAAAGSALYTPQFKRVVLLLFFVSLALYLIFTVQLPWTDVFIEPDWR